MPDAYNTRQICDLAAQGLVPMLDPAKKLFCFRLLRSEAGMIREEISERYTIMTLLGLLELERAGGKSPIAIGEVFDALMRDRKWVNNAGDLGLLIWQVAALAPERFEEIAKAHDVNSALTAFRDARESHTMELSWLLTGLSEAALTGKTLPKGWQELAKKTYEQLCANQGKHGFFGHLSKKAGVRGVIRGAIGSFADQVYPSVAFPKYARAFGAKDALQRAQDCTAAICKAQGPLGQWWWHYDSRTGRVVQEFPVYSVHQHGMGPMALFAVAAEANCDFSDAIRKSLAWLDHNELNTSMTDESLQIIWRCIEPASKSKLYAREILRAVRGKKSAAPAGLRILHECRPYELGWLLYAFAPHTRFAAGV